MGQAKLKLLTREEIQRRFVRMTGVAHVKRPTEITRADVAKWFGVDVRLIRMHGDEPEVINDFWQYAYSVFFELMDAGLIELRYENGKKVLVRVARPGAPVKKKLRPFVNFSDMSLGFDR